VIERARPIPPGTATDNLQFTNHGGIALVAPTGIKAERLKPAIEPTTFEHMLVKLTSEGASCVLAVLYRPGSAQITQTFFNELESLVDVLSTMSAPCAITGDLNVRLDRPEDQLCQPLTGRVRNAAACRPANP